MKKYYFMAFAALVSLVMISCKKNDPVNPTTDLKVTVNPKTLDIAVGDQGKLRAAITPAKEGVTISFVSENEAVATVNASGLVTGVAAGTTNIIAKAEGAISDTCVVNVVDASDLFAWGGIVLVGEQTEKVGEEYNHWDEEDSCYYKCQNFIGTFYAWSSDIIFTSGVGFSGAGFFSQIKAPVAIIQEGNWTGYYYMPELLFTDTIDATKEGACAPGSLTDAAEWHEYLFNDSTYEGDGTFKGFRVDYYDFDNEDNNLPFVGFIKNGWLYGNTTAVYYQMNITWFDMDEGLYGLKMEQNEEGKWQFVQPYEFTTRYDSYYELLPQSKAKHKMQPMRITNQEQVRKLKNLNTQKLHVSK
jgi:hypothetical protein